MIDLSVGSLHGTRDLPASEMLSSRVKSVVSSKEVKYDSPMEVNGETP